MTRSPPPPPPLTKLATFFLLAVLAAPLAAQTTVTSGGRDGPTTCMGEQQEVNATAFDITSITTSLIRYTTPAVTWGQYTGRLGDLSAPIRASVYAALYNAKTQARVGQASLGDISSTRNISARSTPLARTVSAKTSYYLEINAAATGSIPKQVFARRCFMTGGTYTMNVAPGTEGRSSGCFSISPFTQQDVRNCWCGRRNNLPLFSSTQGNTDWHNMWGCR